MQITISDNDGRPVYLRIVAAVRAAAARAEIAPGDPLPAVRTLAAELQVHPNTVLQAYGELARLGLVASQRGRGTFLLPFGVGPAERRKLAEEVAERAIHDAHAHGLSVGELVAALERAEATAHSG